MDLSPESMVFLMTNINILQCECSFAMIIQDFNDQIDSFFYQNMHILPTMSPLTPRSVNI